MLEELVVSNLGLIRSASVEFSRGLTVVTGETFEPDSEAHRTYSKLFPMYKQLYLDTKHHFHRLVELDLPQGWIGKGDK